MLQKFKITSYGFIICLFGFTLITVSPVFAEDSPEFVVIADSWHPHWQAIVNGKDTPIIKTNGTFKGILLPPGEGTVRLFFDNSPYHPGIWISIVSWSLFLLGWGWCALRLRERY